MAWRSISSSTSPRASKARSNSARARSRPERFDQTLGALAQAGDHLAAIAARGAPADLAAFEQHHLQPALGGVKRRRQAGAAAADDHQVGLDIALQRRMVRRRIGRRDIIGFADIQAGIEAPE